MVSDILILINYTTQLRLLKMAPVEPSGVVNEC